jgi:hypothetical protein
MEKIKKITINLKRWHLLAIISAAFFLMSYFMASTCPVEDIAMKGFNIIFMVAFAAGSIVLAIAAIVLWYDGND